MEETVCCNWCNAAVDAILFVMIVMHSVAAKLVVGTTAVLVVVRKAGAASEASSKHPAAPGNTEEKWFLEGGGIKKVLRHFYNVMTCAVE